MSKLLLGIILVETVALVLLLAGDIALPTGLAVQEVTKNLTPLEDNGSGLVFSTYTKAICNKETDPTVCNDRIFVKCGDLEHMLPDVLNSITIRGNWEDPRSLENNT